jgi:hypothetical protein
MDGRKLYRLLDRRELDRRQLDSVKGRESWTGCWTGESWTALLDGLLDRKELDRASGWESAGQGCWTEESWTGLLDGREVDRKRELDRR